MINTLTLLDIYVSLGAVIAAGALSYFGFWRRR